MIPLLSSLWGQVVRLIWGPQPGDLVEVIAENVREDSPSDSMAQTLMSIIWKMNRIQMGVPISGPEKLYPVIRDDRYNPDFVFTSESVAVSAGEYKVDVIEPGTHLVVIKSVRPKHLGRYNSTLYIMCNVLYRGEPWWIERKYLKVVQVSSG